VARLPCPLVMAGVRHYFKNNKSPNLLEDKALSQSINKNNPLPKKVFDLVNEGMEEFMGMLKGFCFSQYHNSLKKFRKSRKCIFPDCTNKSISSSHTIQRSSTLEFIAENQHILTPTWDINTGGFIMKAVSTRKASAFPGFCEQHEQIFFDYEREGKISTNRHVVLQVFRTICREIVIREIELENAKRLLAAYNELISEKGLAYVKQKPGNELLKKYNLKLRAFTVDQVNMQHEYIKGVVERLQKELSSFKEDFFRHSLNDINGVEDGLSHFIIWVDDIVPLCLAGSCNCHIEYKGLTQNVRAILNVIPITDQTIISISAQPKHEEFLNNYAGQFLKMNGPLIMVETWMVNGSFHWFITPSEWMSIPQERQDQILSDIRDDRYSIGHPYPRSIIDTVRQRMINLLEAKKHPEVELKREIEKLSDR